MRSQQWVSAFNHDFGLNQPNASATNPYAPYGTTAVFNTDPVAVPHTPHSPTVPLADNNINAIHMALIPKGPHQGKVLVWNHRPIYGNPTFDPSRMWSFQQWAIVDPRLNPPAGTPRFLNFFLPIGPVTGGPGGVYGDNIFCAGEVWDHNGNLIVVGGTKWNGGAQAGPHLTFVFDPGQDSAPFPDMGLTQPLYTWPLGTPDAGNPIAGMWLKGPFLANTRYYPTAVFTHSVARTQGPGTGPVPTVVVHGGDTTDPAEPSALNVGNSNNWPTWNSYETVRIDREPRHPQAIAGGDPGLSMDSVTIGTSTHFNFEGPGTGLPSSPTSQQIADALTADWLWFYPRAHLLTSGKIVTTGFTPNSRLLDHDAVPIPWSSSFAPPVQAASNWFPNPSLPGIGANNPGSWNGMRTYGASVRMPNVFGNSDTFFRIGGAPFITALPILTTENVEVCDFSDPGSAVWIPIAPLNHRRAVLNAVLLPDASIIVFGGADQLDSSGAFVPVFAAEQYVIGSDEWTLLPSGVSPRTYHSTALLLPDGRVLVAGGNDRSVDYELFEPANITAGPRPQNVAFRDLALSRIDEVGRATEFVVDCDSLPFGNFIERVVLMAPGATTHHSDMCQRYHQLVVDPDGPVQVRVKMPPTDKDLPSGYYMCYAVTNKGVPSEAVWIKLLPN